MSKNIAFLTDNHLSSSLQETLSTYRCFFKKFTEVSEIDFSLFKTVVIDTAYENPVLLSIRAVLPKGINSFFYNLNLLSEGKKELHAEFVNRIFSDLSIDYRKYDFLCVLTVCATLATFSILKNVIVARNYKMLCD
jgi:hypothetical protein